MFTADNLYVVSQFAVKQPTVYSIRRNVGVTLKLVMGKPPTFLNRRAVFILCEFNSRN
jgi:hypothetical protein